MTRREFIKWSALAAAGAPFGAKAWEKPIPVLAPQENEWIDKDWEDCYRPKEFIYLKPSVQIVGSDRAAIFWKTKDIATGWADVSQDGGATWRRIWTDTDGIRDINTTTHLALVEGYDLTKPLKYRVMSLPIAEYSQWGNCRFSGETLPPKALKGYYINAKAYKELVKQRKEKYVGEEFHEEGEIAAVDSKAFDIVMFNDVHHVIPAYPKLLKHVAGRPIALAVFAGDICDHARSEPDYDKHLDAPLAYLSRHCGVLTRYVRGNHETMGLYSPYVRKHIALQDDAFYGAVTIGDTRILFLDTGNDSNDDDNSWAQSYYGMVPYFARERRWLEKELASPEWKNAKHRIAFSHIPPSYGPSENFQNLFARPLAAANVTLFMAGHEHNGAFIEPTADRPYPLIIGGGPYDKCHGKRNDILTISTVSVRSEGITVAQHDLNGREVFNRNI